MRWRYVIIFLTGVLCLVSSNDLFSQHCFKMSYDKNGNRICFMANDCGGVMRGELDIDDVFVEKCEDYAEDILVYPNPNNGRFKIELKNADVGSAVDLYVYDNKGVLVNAQKFFTSVNVDISDNPAGVYLLRINGEKCESSIIVVKY